MSGVSSFSMGREEMMIGHNSYQAWIHTRGQYLIIDSPPLLPEFCVMTLKTSSLVWRWAHVLPGDERTGQTKIWGRFCLCEIIRPFQKQRWIITTVIFFLNTVVTYWFFWLIKNIISSDEKKRISHKTLLPGAQIFDDTRQKRKAELIIWSDSLISSSFQPVQVLS